jgi:hypothetical protein
MTETDAQLSVLRKQETEMKSQVNKALASANKYKEELEHIKELHEGKIQYITKTYSTLAGRSDWLMSKCHRIELCSISRFDLPCRSIDKLK